MPRPADPAGFWERISRPDPAMRRARAAAAILVIATVILLSWLQIRSALDAGQPGPAVIPAPALLAAGANLLILVLILGAALAALRQLGQQQIDGDELARARDAAQEASRIKSEFLANMSHEVRTPLNGMLGAVQLLERSGPGRGHATQIQRLRLSADALLVTINSILDYSKLEAGQLAVEVIDFDTEALLERAISFTALPAEEKGLALIFDLPADLPRRLMGDPVRIGQIVHNLLGNAIKFTHEGGVTLQLRVVPTAPGAVLLSISIADTGMGMSEAQRSHLFSPFHQADSSISRRFGGTGLGLAICKRLAEAMGGQIFADSAPGLGSTFHVTVPLALADSAMLEPRRAPWPRRVLLVDAHPERRCGTAALLAAFGDEVTAADSCAAALAHLADPGARPDIVLLDATATPGAHDVARWVQGAMTRRAPEIIVQTGHGRSADLVAEQWAGMRHWLATPFVAGSLFQALAAASLPAPMAAPGRRPPAAVAGRLAGRRILVAEDNRINREIACDMLRAEGALVEAVENGEDALAAVARSQQPGHAPVEIVLMDVQMPGLDGHEATRRLRASPQNYYLPVIALTAHGASSEHARSLAAGMNDHLTKPIDADQLIATLKRWLPAAALAPDTLWRPPAAIPGALAVPAGLAGIDVTRALARLDGQAATYLRLLCIFVEQCPRYCDNYRNAKGAAQRARVAHDIKGTAASLGFAALGALAADHEALWESAESRAGDDEKAIEALCAALQEARAAARALVAANEATATPAAGQASV